MRLTVALYNFRDGGPRRNGSYDFAALPRAFADVADPPALIMLCEAKGYADHGKAGLLGAAAALSEELNRPYAGELGWCDRGPFGPAIFYDPNALRLQSWWDPSSPGAADDKRNLARFRARDSGVEILALVQHWDFRSGTRRRQEAGVIDRYGEHDLPVIVGGDLNATASGPHLPQRDWHAAGHRARAQKGRELPDGSWVADADAVDHLIGRWDPKLERHVGGCGFAAVAELAAKSGTPLVEAYRPTVNDGVDAGGGLLIDWLLANPAMATRFIPHSYRVHLSPEGSDPPSDHRLVTAAFDLTLHSTGTCLSGRESLRRRRREGAAVSVSEEISFRADLIPEQDAHALAARAVPTLSPPRAAGEPARRPWRALEVARKGDP